MRKYVSTFFYLFELQFYNLLFKSHFRDLASLRTDIQQDKLEEAESEKIKKERKKKREKDLTTVRSLLDNQCRQANLTTKVVEKVQTFVIWDCSSSTKFSLSGFILTLSSWLTIM